MRKLVQEFLKKRKRRGTKEEPILAV